MSNDPLTDLVERFSKALLAKLRLAEANGRSGWDRDDWEKQCQEGLLRHVDKGDPRDVAAYCAFMWHHGWSTALTSTDGCVHSSVHDGPRVDMRWGTAPTQVCECGAWRTMLHVPGQWQTTPLTSTNGCTCQEQHRRGHCTEPGCPYAVTRPDGDDKFSGGSNRVG